MKYTYKVRPEYIAAKRCSYVSWEFLIDAMNAGSPNDRPLYLEVRDKLIDRIRLGEWGPGEAIPSEFEVADEYDVGQGTARKAIAALAEENLVVRRQGLGTFVFEHTPNDILTRFFGFYDAKHELIVPGSEKARPERGRATPIERSALRLGRKASVIRISRVRTRKGKRFIVETISVPEALFPELADSDDVPNTLYDFYQKSHRVLVVRTDERLNAVAADRATAKTLGIAEGSPLLRIERIAFALGDAPVEWRVRLCHLDDGYYLARRK
jgi:GntR family transcriptional regulator